MIAREDEFMKIAPVHLLEFVLLSDRDLLDQGSQLYS